MTKDVEIGLRLDEDRSDWYDCNWKHRESRPFVLWWESYYPASELLRTEEEIEEYWIRRAFALAGWIAARESQGDQK